MSSLASTCAVIALAAVAGSPAQDAASCCSGAEPGDAREHGATCAHRRVEPLPEVAEGASAKERRLRAIHEQALVGRHIFLSQATLGIMRELWESSESGADTGRRLGARLTFARYLVNHGRIDESLEHYAACVEWARELPGRRGRDILKDALFHEAIAWFRLAERRNCIANHNADSCIFPFSAAAVHVEKAGAARAEEVLAEILALDPGYREAQWLLNIAHMALGTWPAGVPEAYRYPPECFASEGEIERFYDVAPKLGLDRFTRAGSAVMDDFDGDGRLDVMTSTFETDKNVRLFRSGGDGTFADVTDAAGLRGQLGGTGLVQADVNGDGRLDVLVLRGGGLHTDGEMPESLLVQDAEGVFHDVTAAAGIELEAPARSAAFADVDADGDLDLFVGYESWIDAPTDRTVYPSRLYRNDGTGRFEDVTAESGIVNRAACVAAAFGDYDGDGDPDLYVSNRMRPNALFRNDGDWKFTDVAGELGVTEPAFSRDAWFFDPDQDGDLDLFVAFHGHVLRDRKVAEYYRDGTVSDDTVRLYQNDGAGGFDDVTEARGLRRVAYVLGAASGDVDGDGFPDVYLATGAHEMSSLWPNVMLRNDGGARFLDVTRAGGLGHLQKGNGMAFGDLDDDGDQDLFLQVGGLHLDDAFGDVLFENPGHGNAWLTVELEGTRSNRFGIGARVRVRIEEPDGERDVWAHVGSGGSFGGSSLRAEIGLGAAERILVLEVTWPGGAGIQTFDEVPLDRIVRVRQGEDGARVLERAALVLGGR